MQEMVYKQTNDELREHILAAFDQCIIDNAIRQWRTCQRENEHFEHKLS